MCDSATSIEILYPRGRDIQYRCYISYRSYGAARQNYRSRRICVLCGRDTRGKLILIIHYQYKHLTCQHVTDLWDVWGPCKISGHHASGDDAQGAAGRIRAPYPALPDTIPERSAVLLPDEGKWRYSFSVQGLGLRNAASSVHAGVIASQI